MKTISLGEAVEIVNSTRRGPSDPPLLVIAVCGLCNEQFAMQPQDASRAEVHNLEKVCRFCIPKYRAEARRGRGLARTYEERIIIYKHAVAKDPREVCDADLAKQGYPLVHPGSYASNLRREGPLFRRHPELLEKFARHPVPYGHWELEWRR